MRTYFQTVCATSVEPDGLTFQPNTVMAQRIREDQAYAGVRVRMVARLGAARIPIKVDVGFGDVITPAAVMATMPTLLDAPPLRIRAYPPETVVAEKCHAIIALGAANTRMKDFYDLYVLSEVRDFEGALLVSAVAATFRRRATELPSAVAVGLTAAFAEQSAKQVQWTAWLRRRGLRAIPADFAAVVRRVAAFLQPVIDAAREGAEWSPRWAASGWRAAGRGGPGHLVAPTRGIARGIDITVDRDDDGV